MVERTLLRLGKPSFIIVDPEWDTIVSVSAATRLAYDMYFDTYVRWSHHFIFGNNQERVYPVVK